MTDRRRIWPRPGLGSTLGGALGLSGLTAALLTSAFPGPAQGWLAWIALGPVALACLAGSSARVALLVLVAGTLAALGIFRWILALSGMRWYQVAILALYLGLYPALWCAALPRLERSRIPLVLTAPGLWVLLEWIRGHAGFLALPWATLAHSQHRDLPVLQVAALTGEAGVSFLVVLPAVAAAAGAARREWRSPMVAAGIVVAAHLGGVIALVASSAGRGTMVAAVQPAIRLGERASPDGAAAILDRLEALTRAATAAGARLVAWPESAVTNLSSDGLLQARVFNLVQETGVPLLIGSADSAKFAAADPGGPAPPLANLAYLVTPGEPLPEPYRKRRLVPFGEYPPLAGVVRWPAWLVTPPLVLAPGDALGRLVLPEGTPLGVVICWENLFPELARDLVQNGARLLVQLTNDAWFGRTAEPEQHWLASVLRAVENRVPVLVASNTGLSALIDARGRVVARATGLFTAETVTGVASLDGAGSVYTRAGDWFVAVAATVAALGWLTARLPHGRDRLLASDARPAGS